MTYEQLLIEGIAERDKRIAELERQMAEILIEAEEVAGQAIKAFDRDDKRITELEALCKECADYLDTNKFTSIHSDSYLHRDLRTKATKEEKCKN